MKKCIVALGLSLVTTFSAAATIKESALTFVPKGTIVQEKDKEIKIQTEAGGIVEVEFQRDGTFEEASGESLDKDIFVPGQGLLSLKDALASLKTAGKNPSGGWSIEKSLTQDWYYDFEGYESGAKMEYRVDAKTGKLLSSKVDN